MYTYLLLLSSLFSFKAFTDDDAILAQSAAASAMGAVYVLFHPRLVNGLWATRTPAIRDLLALSTAEMGVVLFGLSVGSMSGILCSAWLVKRFGTRKVIRTTMSFAVLGMLVLSLALWVTSAPLFAFGLAIFGASFGSAEVAINVEGAAIEREMNKTVLPMMHGFYSFGTLFGAGVGMAVTGFGLPAAPHILAAALVAILPIAIAIRAIPDGTGKNAAEVAHGEAKGLPVWRDAQLLLIGVIVLAMAFAEGSANDWLPLLMVDGHGFSPTSGSLIYAGFTLGMTLGRFTGGWFIDRYSRVAVVRGSAVMGALGIGLIIFVDNPGGGHLGAAVGHWRLARLPADHLRRQRYRAGRAQARQRGGDHRLSRFPRRAATAGFPRRTLRPAQRHDGGAGSGDGGGAGRPRGG